MQMLIVSPGASVSGAFHTIEDAIASIPDNNTTHTAILVAPGIYREKLTLEKPFVTILGMGESPADTVITYDDYANAKMPDGTRRGTFRSYTLFVHAHDVTLRNLTIENAAGDSKTHGQAIALYAECDRLFVDSCRLLGHQDTLFTGPLPPEEYEPGGFTGPTESAPRINGRQYYRNCYICGDIDFIFGSATAYFEKCTLESLRRTACSADSDAVTASADTTEGYVTAASTPEGQEYGYVFCRCNFVSDDCPPASVYLGRPWRDYARVVLIECDLGKHIHPAGFHDWNKTQAHETVFFAEYDSQDFPGTPRNILYTDPSQLVTPAAQTCFSEHSDFVHTLDEAQAAHFSKEKVLSGDDGWTP